jgi:predicted nuclease of predicted toxin-antitoxin system
MRFKLDENFGSRSHHVFSAANHDVQTVRQEALQGSSDVHLFEVCCAEKRCLVTLDLDFTDVTRFPPNQSNGIVVIRLPHNPNLNVLENLIRQFLQALERSAITSLDQKLWIVEPGRIRIHQSEN